MFQAWLNFDDITRALARLTCQPKLAQALKSLPGNRPEVLEVREPLFLTAFFEVAQRSQLLLLRLEPEPAGEREVARLASLHLTLYTSSRLPVII